MRWAMYQTGSRRTTETPSTTQACAHPDRLDLHDPSLYPLDQPGRNMLWRRTCRRASGWRVWRCRPNSGHMRYARLQKFKGRLSRCCCQLPGLALVAVTFVRSLFPSRLCFVSGPRRHFGKNPRGAGTGTQQRESTQPRQCQYGVAGRLPDLSSTCLSNRVQQDSTASCRWLYVATTGDSVVSDLLLLLVQVWQKRSSVKQDARFLKAEVNKLMKVCSCCAVQHKHLLFLKPQKP